METMLCLDDGCAFGLGAFETIAVENGRPCFLAEHLQRLEEALHFLRIACDRTMLQKRIQDELHCQKLPHHALKLMVSDRNIAVTIRPNPYPGSRRFTGIRLCVSPVRRNETSPLTYRKHGTTAIPFWKSAGRFRTDGTAVSFSTAAGKSPRRPYPICSS